MPTAPDYSPRCFRFADYTLVSHACSSENELQEYNKNGEGTQARPRPVAMQCER